MCRNKFFSLFDRLSIDDISIKNDYSSASWSIVGMYYPEKLTMTEILKNKCPLVSKCVRNLSTFTLQSITRDYSKFEKT